MKRVLMDISADLTRIALAEDGELKELYYESKREESLVGNVYAGRVANVMPNLQAAFVDIGAEKTAIIITAMQEPFPMRRKAAQDRRSGIRCYCRWRRMQSARRARC